MEQHKLVIPVAIHLTERLWQDTRSMITVTQFPIQSKEYLKITEDTFGWKMKNHLCCHYCQYGFFLWSYAYFSPSLITRIFEIFFCRILRNRDWYKDNNVIEFMSKFGSRLRLGQMLSRKRWILYCLFCSFKHQCFTLRNLLFSQFDLDFDTSVQSRISSEYGMSFCEFTYQLFQAYDWFHLHQNHNCKFQVIFKIRFPFFYDYIYAGRPNETQIFRQLL